MLIVSKLYSKILHAPGMCVDGGKHSCYGFSVTEEWCSRIPLCVTLTSSCVFVGCKIIGKDTSCSVTLTIHTRRNMRPNSVNAN